MKIVVTGSSGSLGGRVVQELIQHGHEVIAVDVAPSKEPDAPPTRQVDLTHIEGIRPVLRGADAVCHLGSHPSFYATGKPNGFSNNVTGTFNVFEACDELGIGKIVYASSIQAYGLCASRQAPPEWVSPPLYLPVDEDHPLLPRDAYPLSKAMGEQIADSYIRRKQSLQVFSLRFPAIYSPYRTRPRRMGDRPKLPTNFASGDLFSLVHVDDAARAVRLCCEIDRPGHTPLNITSRRAAREWTMENLVAQYARVPEMRRPLEPTDPLLDWRRAREILGFVADLGREPADVSKSDETSPSISKAS